MSIRYRPEIDGLRAVAVVSVLIYHLKLEWNGFEILSGGFLGVDVFFVISGFLITSLIHKEWSRTGRFSIPDFYERRARRLLPALFTVIFASAIAAWFWLLPSAMMDFSKSVLASIFFVSNIFWDFASQVYGARSGLLQPFLHTWSLAVEEQFYLTFPLIYVLFLRYAARSFVYLGFLMVVLGLVLAELLTAWDFSFSFYWLFSRIWELMAGALLAHALSRNPGLGRNWVFARFMPGLGLLLISVSLLGMKVQWHHPGIGTTGAVLGTVFVIWFAGHQRDWGTRFLSSHPTVGIGLISYSLYLWHYPIFAFGRILNPTPNAPDYIVWLALSFGFSILTYFRVERPFRDRRAVPLPQLFRLGTAATVVAAAFCITLIAADGMRSRFPGLIALYSPNEFDNEALRNESWLVLNGLAAARGLGQSDAQEPSEFETDHLWFDPADAAHKVLIVGDSHSKDMFNSLHLAREELPGFAFARFGMSSDLPEHQRQVLFDAANFQAADTVALSFRYLNRTLDRLPGFIEEMKARNKRVILFLNTTEFNTPGELTLFDQYLREHRRLEVTALNRLAWTRRDLERTSPINARLRDIAARHAVAVRDKEAFICTSEQASCAAATPEGAKVFYDYGHFTLEGAAYFGLRIAEIEWLGPAPP